MSIIMLPWTIHLTFYSLPHSQLGGLNGALDGVAFTSSSVCLLVEGEVFVLPAGSFEGMIRASGEHTPPPLSPCLWGSTYFSTAFLHRTPASGHQSHHRQEFYPDCGWSCNANSRRLILQASFCIELSLKPSPRSPHTDYPGHCSGLEWYSKLCTIHCRE